MIKCPNCHCRQSKVVKTRHASFPVGGERKEVIRRKRVCRYCGKAWWTSETIESEDYPMPGVPDVGIISPDWGPDIFEP